MTEDTALGDYEVARHSARRSVGLDDTGFLRTFRLPYGTCWFRSSDFGDG
jgi:hypothetical protein